mmetsp:Transcript_741/g.807  ORF Transcript_741/g.807 Transcript_741/m.807 type:complete len:90 (+) Transcript_741:131-400(+)
MSQNLKLEQAKRTAHESLEVALTINTNLKDQTDTLTRNLKRIDEVNDDLSWSNKLIGDINKKMMQNRMMFCSVLGVIGLACVGIVATYF